MQFAVNTGTNYFELCGIFGKIMSFTLILNYDFKQGKLKSAIGECKF